MTLGYPLEMRKNWEKYIFSFFSIIFSFLSINAYELWAHNAERVHPLLSGKGIELLDSPYAEIKTYADKIKESSTEEDRFPNMSNHFYNPLTREGLAGFRNAVDYEKARAYWLRALQKYIEGNKEDAYYLLGRMVHLVQDMSVPAHVQVDPHIMWVGDDDYEEWCKDKDKGLQIISNMKGTQWQQPATLSFEEFMREMAWITYISSSFYGGISQTNELVGPVLDADLELSRMFPSLRFEGYYFWIDKVGNYGGMTTNEWWPCRFANGELTGFYYIENIGGMNGEGVIPAKIRKDITELNPYPEMNPNDRTLSLYQIFSEKLIPLSINYTAGLLKYFYDLVNDPPYVEKVTITQAGVTRYNAYWARGQTERTLTPDTQEGRNLMIVNGQDEATVTIEFSEKVKDVNIIIGSISITGTQGHWPLIQKYGQVL